MNEKTEKNLDNETPTPRELPSTETGDLIEELRRALIHSKHCQDCAEDWDSCEHGRAANLLLVKTLRFLGSEVYAEQTPTASQEPKEQSEKSSVAVQPQTSEGK